MKTKIKVAGTTFHPLPEGGRITITSEFEREGVPCASAQALLIPEPENENDPDAVNVLVRLSDGSPFHIGYIPKAEPLKWKIKAPTLASVVIRDYGQVVAGHNASFMITDINME